MKAHQPSNAGVALSVCIRPAIQAGDVASVLLGFDNSDNLEDSWVDVIALVKVDGAWKITNKTSAHSTRAAWAKPAD